MSGGAQDPCPPDAERGLIRCNWRESYAIDARLDMPVIGDLLLFIERLPVSQRQVLALRYMFDLRVSEDITDKFRLMALIALDQVTKIPEGKSVIRTFPDAFLAEVGDWERTSGAPSRSQRREQRRRLAHEQQPLHARRAAEGRDEGLHRLRRG